MPGTQLANIALSLERYGWKQPVVIDREGYNFRGACMDVGFQIRQCLIWVKNTAVICRQDFYWTLQGTGGMDDEDLVNFVQNMKRLHAQVLDRGVTAEAHTLSVPYEANKTLLEFLKDDMYENFMLMNSNKALAGDKTATAIRLAYQPQDDKCGDFENCIRDFIQQLLALLGIEDEPSFKWNRIANLTEETQMVMTAAQYLDDEAVLNHLSWLTPEEVQALLDRKAADSLRRFDNTQSGIDNIPPAEDEEEE